MPVCSTMSVQDSLMVTDSDWVNIVLVQRRALILIYLYVMGLGARLNLLVKMVHLRTHNVYFD